MAALTLHADIQTLVAKLTTDLEALARVAAVVHGVSSH